MDHNHPNIIYILADQLRYQSCGYAGDTKAHTPNIDGLADESTSFRNMVSSMPVCSAYRATLFTGKYTTSTGMVINEIRMNPNHRCLAHCLTDAGYNTGYVGKWHMYANELGNHNDPKNSFVPPGPDRLGFNEYWAGYNFHHDYYGAYYHTETPDKIFYGDSVYEPDAQTDMAIDYMSKACSEDKPFAMFISVGTPHDPWTPENVPQEYYELFKDVQFPPCASYSDEMDPHGDAWSNAEKSPAQIQDCMRAYYAMTANLDWNVGRILKAIDAQGIREDTIVIFTSDHGEMFGAHGRMKKNIFYDEAARVPFLLRWPARIPKKHVTDVCASNADIMPTLLGLIGSDIPPEVEGIDVSCCALGETGPEPPAAFLQNTGACAAWEDGHEWRALRSKQYTYAIYKSDGKELLFDNVADPDQLTNLMGNPSHVDVLDKFRAMLTMKMASVNDTFEDSTWYRDNWTEARIIKRTATLNTSG